MPRKRNHASKPRPMLSPMGASRRVVTAAVSKGGNWLSSVGHNQYSGKRGRRRRKNIIAGGARAPGAGGPPVTGSIGPGGYRGMN
jgi:hypothetical protein